MALLKIVLYPEPVLHTVGKPVEEFDDRLKKLVGDMFETMYEAGGVGLAAPQVAVSERLFVMDCSSSEDESQKFVMINPEIIHVEGSQEGEEGCLSFPGIYQKIQRNQRTIVRYQDLNGELQELDGMDLTARCILHETDHCDGIVFLDRMTVLRRELAKRKIKRLQKTGKWE
ncbi:MAG: peptide deformylase [Acidobacteria bacterium]|nr:peptide deformylase [Acidobacteriota bacterium]MCA1639050.1 peptide deformylase [Acidobacteriota bacterium]